MTPRRQFFLRTSALLSLLALDAAPGHSAASELRERGRIIANTNCRRCHAIGKSGRSANPKAPPFRHIAKKYPLANLEEALAEGILVGHEGPEMPQFTLSTGQIEALLAYIASIQKN